MRMTVALEERVCYEEKHSRSQARRDRQEAEGYFDAFPSEEKPSARGEQLIPGWGNRGSFT